MRGGPWVPGPYDLDLFLSSTQCLRGLKPFPNLRTCFKILIVTLLASSPAASVLRELLHPGSSPLNSGIG